MIRSQKNLADLEAKMLASYAVLSGKSRGRRHPEPEAEDRLCFQRDRDRILHSRAWRRMKDKTQVFVAHHGDHYRNRLTHSLEVAQISRDLARTLGLNEDLAESIALAHDLGHTPFGHAGEHTLSACLQAEGLNFEHNRQSRRVVEELEHVYPHFEGLNLSIEVLEGMMKHETFWDLPNGHTGVHPSLEAQVVNLGDEIAYQNHDVDDGLRSGLFSEKDLEHLALWKKAGEAVEARYGHIEEARIRQARTVSAMIGVMMKDIAEETSRLLEMSGIKTLEDVYECEEKLVAFSPLMNVENKALKDFLMTRLYLHPEVVAHSKRGQAVIEFLFKHLRQEMECEELRDYLAGMTDSFALGLAQELGFSL